MGAPNDHQPEPDEQCYEPPRAEALEDADGPVSAAPMIQISGNPPA